jgi:hypothetical protein
LDVGFSHGVVDGGQHLLCQNVVGDGGEIDGELKDLLQLVASLDALLGERVFDALTIEGQDVDDVGETGR